MDRDSLRARLTEHGGPELYDRLEHLDRAVPVRPRDLSITAPDRDARLDADVVFLGGGLSLLIAAELAGKGIRVVVLERSRAGAVHREWNASEVELRPLVDSGILSEAELPDLVISKYDHGICQFHGGAPHVVSGVLDHAVDAAALLERVRSVAERRGVRFIDQASVTGLGAGADAVAVAWAGGQLTARLAVDARGAASPYGGGDLVCPTVGGVVSGLDFDARVGDILVTTDGVEDGRQHIWEGFPGRPGELTVYLFHYAERRPIRTGELLSLYGRFFDRLSSYRPGVPKLIRPTFGYITGWSRLGLPPSSGSPRVLLVGDAAARHSPLTFCGFGSMLRSFRSVAARIATSVEGAPVELYDEASVHAWTGLLARMMTGGKLRGQELNVLLDSAFASLEELGNDTYSALLQDRMSAAGFIAFLRQTARKQPTIYRDVLRVMGGPVLLRWGARLASHRLRDALSPP